MGRRPASFSFALLVIAGVAAGQQPGARRLVYELPIDALQRSLRGRPEVDLESLLAGTIATLQARLGEELVVRRDGASRCVVAVPAERAGEIAAIRRLVERKQSLELRIVAAGARRDAFDLPAERTRLQAWLDAGGRERVLADPDALREFHADAVNGPVAGARLQWRVHRVHPEQGNPARWGTRFADVAALRDACVPLFSEQQWNGGVRAAAGGAQAPASLVELVALDFAQRGFTGADVDPDEVALQALPAGDAGVRCPMRAELRQEYGNWTAANVERATAVVWNGEVIAAPIVLGRIRATGVITGMPPVELMELVRFLRAGGLLAPPRFVREESGTLR